MIEPMPLEPVEPTKPTNLRPNVSGDRVCEWNVVDENGTNLKEVDCEYLDSMVKMYFPDYKAEEGCFPIYTYYAAFNEMGMEEACVEITPLPDDHVSPGDIIDVVPEPIPEPCEYTELVDDMAFLKEMDCTVLHMELEKEGVELPADCWYDIWIVDGKWKIYTDDKCGTDNEEEHAEDWHQYLREQHYLDELKLAVKEAKHYLKDMGLEINMPKREGGKRKSWKNEPQIPACRMEWTYQLNGEERVMASKVPMKIFEIPEVFGEDCDQKCAQEFTDCLTKDARRQKLQRRRMGRNLENFAPGEWHGAEDSMCQEKFDTLLWNAAKMQLEFRGRNLRYWQAVGQWLVDLSKDHQIWVPEFIAAHSEDFYQYLEDQWEETGVDQYDGHGFNWEEEYGFDYETGMEFINDFFGGHMNQDPEYSQYEDGSQMDYGMGDFDMSQYYEGSEVNDIIGEFSDMDEFSFDDFFGGESYDIEYEEGSTGSGFFDFSASGF